MELIVTDPVLNELNAKDIVYYVHEYRIIRKTVFVHSAFPVDNVDNYIRHRMVDKVFSTYQEAGMYILNQPQSEYITYEIKSGPRWSMSGILWLTCECETRRIIDLLQPPDKRTLIPVYHAACAVHQQEKYSGQVIHDVVDAECSKLSKVQLHTMTKLGVAANEVMWGHDNDRVLHIIIKMTAEQKSEVIQHLSDNGHSDVIVHAYGDQNTPELTGAFLAPLVGHKPSVESI